MATIQRSLLIEAPVAVSYSFWTDFSRFPEFMEDLAGVQGGPEVMTWTVRRGTDSTDVEVVVTERIEMSLLSWRRSDGPERSAVLTFAPLEGQATWFTLTLEYEPEEGHGNVAGRLTATARRLDRELRKAREMIEGEAHAQRARVPSQEQCPG